MRDDILNSGAENNPGANPIGERVQPGTPVYDAAGASIGQVGDRGFERGGLSVRRGGLVPRDVTIPASAVERTDANGVVLSVTKDQLDAMGDDMQASAQAQDERIPSPQQPRATDAGAMPPDLDAAMPPGVEANPDDADTRPTSAPGTTPPTP